MNILSLIPAFPFPPDDGTKIQAYHRIKHLARHNRVTLVCFQSTPVAPEHLAEMQRVCRVHLISAEAGSLQSGWAGKGLNFARSLARLTPHYLDMFKSNRAVSALERLVAEQDFDVIEADATAGVFLNPDWRELKVLIKHSVTNTALRREIRVTRQPGRKLRRLAYWPLERRHERHLCRNADLCVTLTEQCAREVRRLDAGIHARNALTNGVDLAYFGFEPPRKTPAGVCFVGRMDYTPNLDAIDHFHRRIWPHVSAAHPEASVWVVGAHAEGALRGLRHAQRVHLCGYVEDVRPFLRHAGIAVVPLRAGSGIINKVLEALALGVPAVVTTRATEGLGVLHERELLIADDPQTFGACVSRLFAEPELRRRLAVNGRAYVEKMHAWDAVVDRYERTLKEALCRHR